MRYLTRLYKAYGLGDNGSQAETMHAVIIEQSFCKLVFYP